LKNCTLAITRSGWQLLLGQSCDFLMGRLCRFRRCGWRGSYWTVCCLRNLATARQSNRTAEPIRKWGRIPVTAHRCTVALWQASRRAISAAVSARFMPSICAARSIKYESQVNLRLAPDGLLGLMSPCRETRLPAPAGYLLKIFKGFVPLYMCRNRSSR
jgi:hypothetical protein